MNNSENFGEIYSRQLFKTVFLIVLAISSIVGQSTLAKTYIGENFAFIISGVWSIILVSIHAWFLTKSEMDRNRLQNNYDNLKMIKPVEYPKPSNIEKIEIQHTMERPLKSV